MRRNISKILVTGGAGFIGSEFVRQGVKRGYKIVVVDKLTYAGDLKRLKATSGKFKFYKADICDGNKIKAILKKEKPQAIIHFAAETHVDRSILCSSSFVDTNVKGTQTLLDLARSVNLYKFLHISTDEVYGEIRSGKFRENSPISPNSPYAASKAAADCLVKSYMRTYGFPAIIVRPSNNYGPWQYPEKFIPVALYKVLTGKKIPVYGRGLNKREWLHVSDCARAIFHVLSKGKIGEVYNVGSGMEKRNLDIANMIRSMSHKRKPLIQFVKDRPGHDYRYALNISKISKLGWGPQIDLATGIQGTIQWYLCNFEWLHDKASHLKAYWKKVYKQLD